MMSFYPLHNHRVSFAAVKSPFGEKTGLIIIADFLRLGFSCFGFDVVFIQIGVGRNSIRCSEFLFAYVNDALLWRPI
jgi:hypothetical protein